MTVSPWGTAESRVTLAVASLTVTVPVPFRPPLTVKELPAGSEPVSRSSLKVTVSAVPSTAALENVGAVVSGVPAFAVPLIAINGIVLSDGVLQLPEPDT